MTTPTGEVCQLDGRAIAVVQPSHIYRCPCECHDAAEQLELFGKATA